MPEAEVGHGAGCRANVEGVARGDEDDANSVVLAVLVFGGQQGTIVEPLSQVRKPDLHPTDEDLSVGALERPISCAEFRFAWTWP